MKPSSIDFIREDCERVFKTSPTPLDELNGSSVMITGGTGFMGLWLLEMIHYLNTAFNKGIEVHVVSRNREKFFEEIPHIANAKYVNFIRSDVRTINELPKNLNYIIHAAGNPDNRIHTTKPLDTITTISEGTGAMVRASDRVSNLKMFMNVSSGNVYGRQPDDLEKIPETFKSTISSTDLSSVYSEAKRFSEALVTAARSELRLPVTTIRPFSFLGPYQSIDAPWATNSFINDGINNRSIRILGNGQTVRTIMYGADFALWTLVILTQSKTGQVYNVGADEGKTLYDLAQTVASCFNPRPEVLLNCSLAGNIPNSKHVPDVSKAKSEFNLQIATPWQAAIERTVQWNTKIKKI